MGNQQERLIWLAGFIDGEGYMGIKKVKRANPFSGYQLTARVTIVNTSELAFTFITNLLKEIGVNYSIQYPKLPNPIWKPSYHIDIECLEPVTKLLNLVKPYLIIKGTQAKILLDFISRRKLFPKSKYTESDIKDWQNIKELNQVSSETIRQNAENSRRKI